MDSGAIMLSSFDLGPKPRYRILNPEHVIPRNSRQQKRPDTPREVTAGATTVKIGLRDQTPENALNPPSTGMTIPVTNRDASDASQTATPMRSSGAPKRPMGV